MALVGTSSDAAALQQLADRTTLITYMDENVDSEALAAATAPEQLPSGVRILDVVQDRYLEKVFFEDLNLNILPYAQVVTANDIAKAVEVVGFPAILKPIQKKASARISNCALIPRPMSPAPASCYSSGLMCSRRGWTSRKTSR